jgi:hypothetical protein
MLTHANVKEILLIEYKSMKETTMNIWKAPNMQ